MCEVVHVGLSWLSPAPRSGVAGGNPNLKLGESVPAPSLPCLDAQEATHNVPSDTLQSMALSIGLQGRNRLATVLIAASGGAIRCSHPARQTRAARPRSPNLSFAPRARGVPPASGGCHVTGCVPRVCRESRGVDVCIAVKHLDAQTVETPKQLNGGETQRDWAGRVPPSYNIH
ncbi:hypothetical protein Purlil1_6252 [Purpureocillium lilacinum]|uniref:Uncharacterized protein n=1 Tax=Purpureocillium lilacinum TaxID=33203 RepID=A0ABR0BYT7_PURLI|nr:hypothetical protein Purlil1_6252 [Purpureocillium lilacinum]